LGVSYALTFHGRLPAKTDVQRAYASADIFIMLSENQPNGDVEGFGIAILEANAMGLPAIGATGCGIADAISHNSGILVDGDKPEEIALAVEKMMANYDAYSQGARQWAEQHNWEEILKRIV
jgi:phosphatidylinositol alpha-1,6-mannosyltransferase